MQEEDKQIRENMIRKLCVVNIKENLKRLLQNLEPCLRKKTRALLIMGGNYKEVKKETENYCENDDKTQINSKDISYSIINIHVIAKS